MMPTAREEGNLASVEGRRSVLFFCVFAALLFHPARSLNSSAFNATLNFSNVSSLNYSDFDSGFSLLNRSDFSSLNSSMSLTHTPTPSIGESFSFHISGSHSLSLTSSNDRHIIIQLSGPHTVSEVAAVGTVVGYLNTTGADGTQHAYTLVSGDGCTDNDKFAIFGDELRTAVVFNHTETASLLLNVCIRSTNEFDQWAEQTFNITLIVVTSFGGSTNDQESTIATNEQSTQVPITEQETEAPNATIVNNVTLQPDRLDAGAACATNSKTSDECISGMCAGNVCCLEAVDDACEVCAHGTGACSQCGSTMIGNELVGFVLSSDRCVRQRYDASLTCPLPALACLHGTRVGCGCRCDWRYYGTDCSFANSLKGKLTLLLVGAVSSTFIEGALNTFFAATYEITANASLHRDDRALSRKFHAQDSTQISEQLTLEITTVSQSLILAAPVQTELQRELESMNVTVLEIGHNGVSGFAMDDCLVASETLRLGPETEGFNSSCYKVPQVHQGKPVARLSYEILFYGVAPESVLVENVVGIRGYDEQVTVVSASSLENNTCEPTYIIRGELRDVKIPAIHPHISFNRSSGCTSHIESANIVDPTQFALVKIILSGYLSGDVGFKPSQPAMSKGTTRFTTWAIVFLVFSILLFLLAPSLFGLVILLIYRAKKNAQIDSFGFLVTAAILLVVAAVCLLGGAITLGVSSENKEYSVSHELLLFDYESSLCRDSVLSPQPRRVSKVLADGECHSVDFVGASEGPVYVRATCMPANGSVIVQMFSAASMSSCKSEAASYMQSFEVSSGSPIGMCQAESDFFPFKLKVHQQYVIASCWEAGGFDNIKANYKKMFIDIDDRTTVMANDPLQPVSSKYTAIAKSLNQITYTVDNNVTSLNVNDGYYSFVTFDYSTNNSRVVPVTWQDKVPKNPGFHGFSSNGWLFNRLEPLELIARENRGLFLYPRVAGTDFNIASALPCTITFWMWASIDTRGFVFAVTDSWTTEDDDGTVRAPIIEQTESSLPGGGGTAMRNWTMYYGVYVTHNELHLVATNTNRDGLHVLSWDTSEIAPQLFANEWHFLALSLEEQSSGKITAQLFVDGRSSHVDKGWVRCFPSDYALHEVPAQHPSSSSFGFESKQQLLTHGGTFFAGAFNGGLHDVAVHEGVLNGEELVELGAEGMDADATMSKTPTLIGAIALLVALLIALILTIYNLTQKLIETKKAQIDINVTGSSSSTTSWKEFIQNVLDTGQVMSIQFVAWSWPAPFTFSMGWLRYLTFEIPLPVVDVTVIPCICTFVAVVCLVLLAVAAVVESRKFRRVVENTDAQPNIAGDGSAPPLSFSCTGEKEEDDDNKVVLSLKPSVRFNEEMLRLSMEADEDEIKGDVFFHVVSVKGSDELSFVSLTRERILNGRYDYFLTTEEITSEGKQRVADILANKSTVKEERRRRWVQSKADTEAENLAQETEHSNRVKNTEQEIAACKVEVDRILSNRLALEEESKAALDIAKRRMAEGMQTLNAEKEVAMKKYKQLQDISMKKKEDVLLRKANLLTQLDECSVVSTLEQQCAEAVSKASEKEYGAQNEKSARAVLNTKLKHCQLRRAELEQQLREYEAEFAVLTKRRNRRSHLPQQFFECEWAAQDQMDASVRKTFQQHFENIEDQERTIHEEISRQVAADALIDAKQLQKQIESLHRRIPTLQQDLEMVNKEESELEEEIYKSEMEHQRQIDQFAKREEELRELVADVEETAVADEEEPRLVKCRSQLVALEEQLRVLLSTTVQRIAILPEPESEPENDHDESYTHEVDVFTDKRLLRRHLYKLLVRATDAEAEEAASEMESCRKDRRASLLAAELRAARRELQRELAALLAQDGALSPAAESMSQQQLFERSPQSMMLRLEDNNQFGDDLDPSLSVVSQQCVDHCNSPATVCVSPPAATLEVIVLQEEKFVKGSEKRKQKRIEYQGRKAVEELLKKWNVICLNRDKRLLRAHEYRLNLSTVNASTMCPQHGKPLCNADETYHKVLFKTIGATAYQCTYRLSPLQQAFRHMRGEEMCAASLADRDFYVCTESTCSYACCTECAQMSWVGKRVAVLRTMVARMVRAGVFQIFGFILLMVMQLMFFPLMRRSLSFLYCLPEVQCDFPLCYSDSSPFFFPVMAISLMTIVLLIGQILVELATLLTRQKVIKEVFAQAQNGTQAAPTSQDWNDLLVRDTTIMKDLYAPYKFEKMMMHSVLFLAKFFQILPLVFLDRDSFAQLFTAAGIEVLLLAVVLRFLPHRDHWVAFSSHCGGCYCVGILGLVAFYRLDRMEGKTGDILGYVMLGWLGLYVICQIVSFTFGFIVPLLRKTNKAEQILEAPMVGVIGGDEEVEVNFDEDFNDMVTESVDVSQVPTAGSQLERRGSYIVKK